MEAVGRFAGVLAHDLNNSMMAVRGFAEFIESDSREPETVAYAQQIIRAADGASRMTNQLLVLAEHSSLRLRIIDIVTILAGVEVELLAVVDPRIRLEMQYEIESGLVRVDPDRFGEALRSLALRARDAMPDGGSLTIATSRLAGGGEDGSRIVVSVTDTGPPIEPAVAEQLFDPFLTTGLDPRTGLELAMVFGVVRQSGGEIEVRGGEGSHSTIEIRLPEVEPPPRNALARAPAKPARERARATRP